MSGGIGKSTEPGTPPVRHGRRLPFVALSLLAVSLLTAALGGCSGTRSMAGMPPEVEAAPQVVRQAYTFAVAHPDLMTQIPCYCGCGAIGHTSNYACYISDVDADGAVTYDLHAVGCSICVDITRDAARMLDEGKSVTEIRAEIDASYTAYGPSNMP